MSPSTAFRRIMVPTDFSVSAERAWAMAQRLARATGSELVLIHVVPRRALAIARVGHSSEAARKWAAEELEDCAGKARAQASGSGWRCAPVCHTGRSWRWRARRTPT